MQIRRYVRGLMNSESALRLKESSVRSVVTKEFGVDFVSQGDKRQWLTELLDWEVKQKVKREVGRYGNDTEKLCDEQLTSSSLFEEPTQLP
mmetsp:Transcript_19786/g.31449  ORF Transcript_19786/g.31449 Transcript_19786/m.31449 type:complete len:91 (-) Transcript_19786:183-455(-)